MHDPEDPIATFAAWLDEARAAEGERAEAMNLATVDADGRPSSRMVLLKGSGADGFVFFTDGESRKGRALAAEARVALCFWWPALGRQVRVEGRAMPIAAPESDAYWRRRPVESRLSGWCSRQSQPIADRAALEARRDEARRLFSEGPVPRPPRWGGFRVVPDAIELWAEGPHRLHDRWRFERASPGAPWQRTRLQP